MSRCEPARPRHPRLAVAAALALAAIVSAPAAEAARSRRDVMRFAAEMAENGNWREAQYRWRQAAAAESSDGHVLNNLAVAAEALGEMEAAAEWYAKALLRSNGDPRVAENHRRFSRLREHIDSGRSGDDGDDGKEPTGAEGPASDLPPDVLAGDGDETGGKPVRIEVGVPVPPRLDVSAYETVLVASFLDDESALLDISRELVRFLRGEFRKRTDLDVLDVVPPPAIPEQRPEDLIRNAEFWKHLAREHGADLIVSGVVEYGRRDVSGFEDVDVVSERTGQKVRQTQFVEREEFSYVLDVFFIDGATGTLLFRDQMRRNVVYRESMNDPIHAFYDLSDSIGDDILSVVTTRTRLETRTIFRR